MVFVYLEVHYANSSINSHINSHPAVQADGHGTMLGGDYSTVVSRVKYILLSPGVLHKLEDYKVTLYAVLKYGIPFLLHLSSLRGFLSTCGLQFPTKC